MELSFKISHPLESPVLRVLSLGAGVQSSTLAFMSARGDLPRVDFAVFADTGAEPDRVYRWLDYMDSALPFPIIRAKRDGMSLGELTLSVAAGETPRSGSTLPPLYTAKPDGILPKHCSKEYKTRVVGRVIREKLGLKPGERGPKTQVVEQWLGISTEELQRLKLAEQPYVLNRWPLIEARMNRTDCRAWMAARQLPQPPASSCVWCPFRDNRSWLEMKTTAPEDWAEAVRFDEGIRAGYPGMEGEAFVHRSRVPLRDVDLLEEQGRFDGFNDECEGFCGV